MWVLPRCWFPTSGVLYLSPLRRVRDEAGVMGMILPERALTFEEFTAPGGRERARAQLERMRNKAARMVAMERLIWVSVALALAAYLVAVLR